MFVVMHDADAAALCGAAAAAAAERLKIRRTLGARFTNDRRTFISAMYAPSTVTHGICCPSPSILSLCPVRASVYQSITLWNKAAAINTSLSMWFRHSSHAVPQLRMQPALQHAAYHDETTAWFILLVLSDVHYDLVRCSCMVWLEAPTSTVFVKMT